MGFSLFTKLLLNFCLSVVYRINYALYEELDAGDMERTRDVYRYACLFIKTVVIDSLRIFVKPVVIN